MLCNILQSIYCTYIHTAHRVCLTRCSFMRIQIENIYIIFNRKSYMYIVYTCILYNVYTHVYCIMYSIYWTQGSHSVLIYLRYPFPLVGKIFISNWIIIINNAIVFLPQKFFSFLILNCYFFYLSNLAPCTLASYIQINSILKQVSYWTYNIQYI